MRTTQQFSITLPNKIADIMKTKVAAEHKKAIS